MDNLTMYIFMRRSSFALLDAPRSLLMNIFEITAADRIEARVTVNVFARRLSSRHPVWRFRWAILIGCLLVNLLASRPSSTTAAIKQKGSVVASALQLGRGAFSSEAVEARSAGSAAAGRRVQLAPFNAPQQRHLLRNRLPTTARAVRLIDPFTSNTYACEVRKP